jgi:catechol 2,3-dioxygenase-like lactoylglutathione lyase family enzyme
LRFDVVSKLPMASSTSLYPRQGKTDCSRRQTVRDHGILLRPAYATQSIGGTTLARIRHIAIASEDPHQAAAFFKDAFGLQTLPYDGGPAVGLTDGELNITFIKFGVDQTGVGLDYRGIHHFGVQVDDMDEQSVVLESLGAPCIAGRDAIPPGAHLEIKFRGPDDVVFDISDRPWPGTR